MKQAGFQENRNWVVVSPPLKGIESRFLGEMLGLHYLSHRDYFLVELEKGEVEEWISKTLWDLKKKRVLILGDIVLRALNGTYSLMEWRGSVLPVGDGSVAIASFHPASIFGMPEKTAKKEREDEGGTKYTYGTGKFTLSLDIAKCFRASDLALLRLQRQLVVRPSWEEWGEIKVKIMSAKMATFDVETKGTWVDLLSFAWSATEAVSLPMREVHWGAEWAEFLWDVGEIFRTHQGLVAHNGNFDITLLAHNNIQVDRIWMDTLVAHHWLWCELPHSLAYLTSIMTNEPYYKDTIETEREVYNAKDAAVTWEIADRLLKEMHRQGIQERFFSFLMPLFHTTLAMGNRGVRADVERLQRLCTALAYLIERRKKAFSRFAGKEINLNSPKQVKEYLYEDLKLPVQYARKKKGEAVAKITTNEEAIEKLAKKYNKPGLKLILKVREVEKKRGTYAEVKVDGDGRLRTLFNVAGTDTGRLSSKQTYFNTGWNCQNAPPWFRKNILPDEGKVLVSADLAGADARFFAWLAQEEQMMEVFNDPEGDIHCYVAHRILKIPYKPIDKKSPERKMMKAVVHAFDYGLGVNHAAEMIGCSVAEGKVYRAQYFREFPRVEAYQKEIQEHLAKNRRMVNTLGRNRVFLGRLTGDLFRKAYAWNPQGSVADYIDQGLVKLVENKPEWLDLLLQVHDEIVAQCPPEKVPEAVEVIRTAICVPVIIHNRPLVVPLEFKTGENWGSMENGDEK